MTRAPTENVVEVAPVPGIYTVLMIVAILALWIGIVFSYISLTSEVPTSSAVRGGYGLTIGDMFESSDPKGVGK
jgi:hypothetical protein